MGFADYLKELLRPLGVYDLASGLGSGELEAEGAQLDALYRRLMDIEQEAIPATAEDWGLGLYEDILPYHPASGTTEERREAVMALLRIDDASFTLQDIRDTVAGCGIPADVTESAVPQTVEIAFPGVRGEPDRFEALQQRLEQILPCHLGIVYALVYLTWQEAEDWAMTWQTIEDAGMTWRDLEKYSREVEA